MPDDLSPSTFDAFFNRIAARAHSRDEMTPDDKYGLEGTRVRMYSFPFSDQVHVPETTSGVGI